MKLARAKGKPKTSDAGGDSRFISPHHRRRMEIRRLVAKAPITVRPSLMHLLAHVELATEESARPGAGRIIALERQNEELKERVRESEERCETLKELCGIAEERQRRQEAKTEKLLARVAALEARAQANATVDALQGLERSAEKANDSLRQRIVELRSSIDDNIHRVAAELTGRIRAVELANVELSAKAMAASMAASADEVMKIAAESQPPQPQRQQEEEGKEGGQDKKISKSIAFQVETQVTRATGILADAAVKVKARVEKIRNHIKKVDARNLSVQRGLCAEISALINKTEVLEQQFLHFKERDAIGQGRVSGDVEILRDELSALRRRVIY